MIVKTRATSQRQRSSGSIHQRVAAELEQQRRARVESCQHVWVRGRCLRCPANIRSARG